MDAAREGLSGAEGDRLGIPQTPHAGQETETLTASKSIDSARKDAGPGLGWAGLESAWPGLAWPELDLAGPELAWPGLAARPHLGYTGRQDLGWAGPEPDLGQDPG